jgi:hypothetical protein
MSAVEVSRSTVSFPEVSCPAVLHAAVPRPAVVLLGVVACLAVSGCSAGGTGTSAPDVSGSVAGAGGAPVAAPPVDVPVAPPSKTTDPGGFIVDPSDVPGAPVAEPGAPVLRRRGLIDKQVQCEGEATTTVTGTVYIPSGQLPLYNAMVYVPETELAPMAAGASCNCEISGEPIVSALTDSSGRFVLENVPVGPDIPLVIQVGDWRREINIGTVAPCVETAVADQTLRLPTKQSEGDIPKIAVATGRLDALECLVRKLGVDESEFTNPDGGGRVQLFAGYSGTSEYVSELNEGARFPLASNLWTDVESLQAYDIVLLSCEGDRDHITNKPEQSFESMYEYANLGGRVFASHYHGLWFQRGPGLFPEIAEFTTENDNAFREVTASVVTDFPKGQAMAEWIVNTGTSEDGQVPIRGGAHTIVEENPEYAQRWLSTADPASVQYISANTPLGASDAEQCGRVVLSDIHVSPGPPDEDYSSTNTDFPNGCITNTLSPQEAVLAFMLFDLSACIVPDDQAPVAPPTIIR